MKPPLISVCIVTYNHQAYIADCLMGVLSQWGNFRLEVLVGDDASTDDTTNIIQEIISAYHGDALIRHFFRKENIGPSQNYKELVKNANGDYIAHLDGDDYWLPGKLDAQIKFLLLHSNCSACYTNTVVIQENKSYFGFFSPHQEETINFETLIKSGNFLNHSSLVYRTEFKPILLNFPEHFIDYRIHLALSLHGELGFINQILVAYRVNSTSSQLANMREKVLFMYIDALISTKHSSSPELFKIGIINFCRSFLFNTLINHGHQTARAILSTIREHYPLTWKTILFKILPHGLYRELSSFTYKQTTGRELRFLHRNNKI